MKNVIELFNNYQDDTAIFVLSIAAIIYLLSKAGKRTSDHVYIAIMAAVVLLFNDIMYIAVKMVWSDSAYYALICAFPATIVCAAALAHAVLDKENEWWKKLIFVVGIVVAGIMLFKKDIKPVTENFRYGTEQNALEQMSEVIAADVESRRERICNDAYDKSEYISIAAEPEISGYLRGLDGRYVLAFDPADTTWAGNLQESKPLIYSMVVGGGQTEHNLIREMLSINCVEYTIIKTEFGMDEYMELVGYTKLGEYGSRTLYARDRECYPMRVDYWGYVRRVYFYLLGRRGTYEEVYAGIQSIGSGEKMLDEIAYELLASDEFAERGLSIEEAASAIYYAVFYRDVKDYELAYWREYMNNGGNYHDMYYELYHNSGEFKVEWE